MESSGAPTKSPPPRSTQRGLRCPSTTPSVPGSPLHIFTQTLPPYHPLPHEMWSFARPPPCNVASAKKMLPFLRFQEPGGARYPRYGSLLGSFGVSLPPSPGRSRARRILRPGRPYTHPRLSTAEQMRRRRHHQTPLQQGQHHGARAHGRFPCRRSTLAISLPEGMVSSIRASAPQGFWLLYLNRPPRPSSPRSPFSSPGLRVSF